MNRLLDYGGALLEATSVAMERDPRVYIMGLGVPDPKGIFGTTQDLHKKFGSERAFDIPTAENGMTGIALGSALCGMRPILTHQRLDFALLSMEQIANQAAKWHYMFGGQSSVPMVIRLIIGRGWGQGPQHSQSLHAWFAHIPGLKVVMPTTPYDAKGLLIASIEDDNPVIFLEHRWLHQILGEVPAGHYVVPIGQAKVSRVGSDVTIVASSYMTLEALQAAEILAQQGVQCEVIDLRTILPLDTETFLESVRKTGRLVVADHATKSFGIAGEIIARVVEEDPRLLKTAPVRITLPDLPTPTSPALSRHYYPRAPHLVVAIQKMLGLPADEALLTADSHIPLDVPNKSFRGPF